MESGQVENNCGCESAKVHFPSPTQKLVLKAFLAVKDVLIAENCLSSSNLHGLLSKCVETDKKLNQLQ